MDKQDQVNEDKASGVQSSGLRPTPEVKAAQPSGDGSAWKQKEIERRIKQRINICRHFNGIQHDACKVDVNYRTLVGGDDLGWAARLPCFADDKSDATCEHLSFPTEEEARARVERDDAQVMQFLSRLQGGICPTCNVEVKQKQNGSCVYGTCGHRLYQGTVNPEFAA